MKERILIVHFFGLGDALFLTPVIRALHEAGAARIDLLLGSRTSSLFRINPSVSKIFVVDRDKLKELPRWQQFREIVRLLGGLKKNRYDLLLDYSCRREVGLLAWLWLGIRERIGFDFKRRGMFLTYRIPIPEGFSEKHVLEYYAELLSPLGIPVRSLEMDLFLDPLDEEEASRILKGSGVPETFVCVCPGGGESWGKDAHFKRWAPERFAQLLAELSKHVDFESAVVLGSKQEKELGDRLRASLPMKSVNLCGQTSLAVSSAILGRSLFLLTNDSGMAHIAKAIRVPCISVFGPVDDKIYGPYPLSPRYVAIGREDLSCRPCYRAFRYNAACPTRECLTEFTPEEACKKVLHSGFLEELLRKTEVYSS